MENTVKCDRCNCNVPAGHIKIDLKNKQYLCSSCYGNKQIVKEIAQDMHKPTRDELLDGRSKKICTNCGYRYRYDFDKDYPKACPYCNKAQ